MGQNTDLDTVSWGAENTSQKKEFMVKTMDHDKYLVQNYENDLVHCCLVMGIWITRDLNQNRPQTGTKSRNLYKIATLGDKKGPDLPPESLTVTIGDYTCY